MLIYLHAREIFIRLLFDGADFIAANEARAAYVREHLHCFHCDLIKHRSLFYHCFGTIPQYPCKSCHKLRRQKKVAVEAAQPEVALKHRQPGQGATSKGNSFLPVTRH